MRAVVYRGINDMRVETVPVPTIGPGELLVKVATCGICGTDLKKIHTGSHSAPRIFGHEMSGIIVAVGEGVTRYSGGERVVVHHHVPCGECYYCRKGTPAQCPLYKKVGVTAGFEPSGGGFAEYIRVMDWVAANCGVVPIPDGVPFEQAAFVEPRKHRPQGRKDAQPRRRRHGARHRPGAHRPDACRAGKPHGRARADVGPVSGAPRHCRPIWLEGSHSCRQRKRGRTSACGNRGPRRGRRHSRSRRQRAHQNRHGLQPAAAAR